MKRVNAILSASGLVLALSLPSWAQEVRQLPTHTVTLKGTVETIDHAKHVMNIKTADGKFETVDVPPSAKRFNELKVGDKVSVTYNNNVSARLKPPGEAAVDTGSKTSTGGRRCDLGALVVQRTMTATVHAIDKSASSITFVGPNEWKYSRRVVDPTVFDKVKVGDEVDITWNTDVTVSVDSTLWEQGEKAAQLAPGGPHFLEGHRLQPCPWSRCSAHASKNRARLDAERVAVKTVGIAVAAAVHRCAPSPRDHAFHSSEDGLARTHGITS